MWSGIPSISNIQLFWCLWDQQCLTGTRNRLKLSRQTKEQQSWKSPDLDLLYMCVMS